MKLAKLSLLQVARREVRSHTFLLPEVDLVETSRRAAPQLSLIHGQLFRLD